MNEQELVARIQELQSRLADLREEPGTAASSDEAVEEAVEGASDTDDAKIVINDGMGGAWTIGGAIRANYVLGDYDTGSGPGRGGNGGDMSLDTFRINVSYANGPWLGAAEYRFYTGYNFFHTLYGGYAFDDGSTVKVGLTRVPFGVGPYGPANSWFFDQHYYVGLADDMDLGATYTTTRGPWTFDLGVYAAAEPNGRGNTKDSARYSYDIVDTGAPNAHYTEQGQINARAVYSIEDGPLPTDLGASLQVGRLVADARYADDTIAWAGAVHASSTLGNWGLKAQLTYYDYDPDYNGADASDEDLIAMGAYDYAAPVAAKALIPSLAINYLWTPDISWIDSINFYNDFSVIMKDGSVGGMDMNDSTLDVVGMAIARGGWYIYVDYAFSDGNYFVGGLGDFGANAASKWQKRFNINFGYYF